MHIHNDTKPAYKFDMSMPFHSAAAEEDALMQYSIDLWTTVNSTEPTVKQLIYLLSLIDTKQGVNTDDIWDDDHLTRRRCAAIINALTKLPYKELPFRV